MAQASTGGGGKKKSTTKKSTTKKSTYTAPPKNKGVIDAIKNPPKAKPKEKKKEKKKETPAYKPSKPAIGGNRNSDGGKKKEPAKKPVTPTAPKTTAKPDTSYKSTSYGATASNPPKTKPKTETKKKETPAYKPSGDPTFGGNRNSDGGKKTSKPKAKAPTTFYTPKPDNSYSSTSYAPTTGKKSKGTIEADSGFKAYQRAQSSKPKSRPDSSYTGGLAYGATANNPVKHVTKPKKKTKNTMTPSTNYTGRPVGGSYGATSNVGKNTGKAATSTAKKATYKSYTGTQEADSGFNQYQRAQTTAAKTQATPAPTAPQTTTSQQTYSGGGGSGTTASVNQQAYISAMQNSPSYTGGSTGGGATINLASPTSTSAPTQTPTYNQIPNYAPTSSSSTPLDWEKLMRDKGVAYDWSNPYKGAINHKNTRVYYNGRIIDTSDPNVINGALAKGGRIMGSNLVSGLGKELDLRQLSIAALNGDKSAKAFLEAIKNKGVTGSALWKGYTPTHDELEKSYDLRHAYMKDNPYGDYTKWYDEKEYKTYNEWLESDKPMTDDMLKRYQGWVDKWNLNDMRDPFNQHQANLKKNEQEALNAQDVALNQGLAQMDASAFQQMQQMQQDMSGRGMMDSGIAQDAYMRAQMANNQNYQQAYAQGATTKANIKQQFADAMNESKLGQQEYKDNRADAEAALAVEQQNALAKLQEQQTEQDKFLTSSTGYVYLNGVMMTGKDGKPIRTVDLMKLDETSRHNQATESISMQKMNNDLAIATQKLQYNWATLDLKSQTAQADIANAQAKLELMARNADTAEVKAQAGILNDQLKNIQKQIDGYKKADKKVPDSLKTQLKDIMTKMSTLANMGK